MLGARLFRALRAPAPLAAARAQATKAASRVERALLDAETGPFPALDAFAHRHIGPTDAQVAEMLKAVKQPSLEAMLTKTMPKTIRGTRSEMCGSARAAAFCGVLTCVFGVFRVAPLSSWASIPCVRVWRRSGSRRVRNSRRRPAPAAAPADPPTRPPQFAGGAATAENVALLNLRKVAQKNKVMKNFIGMGYAATHTPGSWRARRCAPGQLGRGE